MYRDIQEGRLDKHNTNTKGIFCVSTVQKIHTDANSNAMPSPPPFRWERRQRRYSKDVHTGKGKGSDTDAFDLLNLMEREKKDLFFFFAIFTATYIFCIKLENDR